MMQDKGPNDGWEWGRRLLPLESGRASHFWQCDHIFWDKRKGGALNSGVNLVSHAAASTVDAVKRVLISTLRAGRSELLIDHTVCKGVRSTLYIQMCHSLSPVVFLSWEIDVLMFSRVVQKTRRSRSVKMPRKEGPWWEVRVCHQGSNRNRQRAGGFLSVVSCQGPSQEQTLAISTV